MARNDHCTALGRHTAKYVRQAVMIFGSNASVWLVSQQALGTPRQGCSKLGSTKLAAGQRLGKAMEQVVHVG